MPFSRADLEYQYILHVKFDAIALLMKWSMLRRPLCVFLTIVIPPVLQVLAASAATAAAHSSVAMLLPRSHINCQRCVNNSFLQPYGKNASNVTLFRYIGVSVLTVTKGGPNIYCCVLLQISRRLSKVAINQEAAAVLLSGHGDSPTSFQKLARSYSIASTSPV
jgi:hypothetical protein